MIETLEEQKFHIRGIPYLLIEKMWPFAEPYIKRALDNMSGEFLPSDIKKMCINRDVQLWLITYEDRVIAAVTTEIVVYPRRKHCRILTFAGTNTQNWVNDFNATIESWAKEQGCNAMEANVRKSYTQKMEDQGYRCRSVSLTKEINHA